MVSKANQWVTVLKGPTSKILRLKSRGGIQDTQSWRSPPWVLRRSKYSRGELRVHRVPTFDDVK